MVDWISVAEFGSRFKAIMKESRMLPNTLEEKRLDILVVKTESELSAFELGVGVGVGAAVGVVILIRKFTEPSDTSVATSRSLPIEFSMSNKLEISAKASLFPPDSLECELT